MKFYIRKLNAQELGYRGGRVRQAGRYILISKELQRENNFFPSFNNNEIEPSVSIGCVNNANNVLVYCEYVWHNGSGHKGKDLRLYLNENIDPLNSFFNKDDYLVFLKIESNGEDLFRMFRFNPADNEYNLLENLTNTIPTNQRSRGAHFWTNEINFIDQRSVNTVRTVISERTINRINPRIGNPIENTHNQTDFKKIIRRLYDLKCAISGTSINYLHYTNLQASHIKPVLSPHNGPHRLDNGILLNLDLHYAFDCGYFTITDDYKIKVHENLIDSSLKQFNNKGISLPSDENIRPSLEYINYHRENIFGRLRPLRND